MRLTEKISSLIGKLKLNASADLDNRIDNEISKALIEQKKTLPAETQPNLWRIIMKTKLTKLATAAVIIIAVMMGINQFGGTDIMTSIAFAEISEAMKEVPWLLQSKRGFEGPTEEWVGFELRIHAVKWANGKVIFTNTKEHKSYTYDPNDKTIKIARLNDFPFDLSSPVVMLDSLDAMLKELGAQITTKEAKYNGQKVQLQEISLSSVGMNNTNQLFRLYIQPESKLLIAAYVKETNPEGDVDLEYESTFSYPQTGPSDIYDLGVPRDTRIIGDSPQ